MSEEFSSKHIIRGTAITSLLTIVSRVLGFFRDLIVASVFGAGALADAYFVAFRIPNLLRSFVAEGALSAAFVPIFSSELKKSRQAAQQAFSAVSALLVLTTVIITVIGIIFADQVVAWIAPGFDSAHQQLCVLLTRIMLPYIIFISLIAMFNGALSSLKSFGAAAASQSIMNVVLIAGGLLSAFFNPISGVIVLSISVLIGGIAQVIFQLPLLRRSGLVLQLQFSGSKKVLGELLRLMAPALLGATIYQLIIFTATMLASLLEPGAVSWLFYADRVIQFPIGIFSIALATVLLPALSENAAANNDQSFADNLSNALRFTSYALIPLSFFLFLCAPDIIALLFQRGAFGTRSVEMTAYAVQALALGIWPISCHSLLVRAFMARRDNRTPTMIGLLTLVTNISLSLMLMGSFGHVGLALASSAASSLAFVVLGLITAKREQTLNWDAFFRSTLQAILSAAIALILCLIAAGLFINGVGRLFILSVLFAIIYLVVGFVIDSRENREFCALAISCLR